MQSNIYGETFRDLRIQKGIKRESFEKIGISKAAITRFENGQSMMGFDRVRLALDILGISLEEYEHFFNDCTKKNRETKLVEIEKYRIQGSRLELKKLEEEAKESGERLIGIVAKSIYECLPEEEVEYITSYLYEVKNWGYTELYVLYLSLEQLNYKDIMYLIELIIEDHKRVLKIEKHRVRMYYILYKGSIELTRRGKKLAAYYLINRLDIPNDKEQMFAMNLRNLAYGYYLYHFEDKKEGSQLIRKALNIIEELCSLEFYLYFQKQYEHLCET